MNEQPESCATVTARDFEAWLTQALNGKRVDPRDGGAEGRIIFLLEDAPGSCRRTDVLMTKSAVEVRGGWCGSEQLTEMTIIASTESWMRYLESPIPENLRPIEIYGYPYLYETLISLLTRRGSAVSVRANLGGNLVKKKVSRRKKGRRTK
jgi:hypothetical protein